MRTMWRQMKGGTRPSAGIVASYCARCPEMNTARDGMGNAAVAAGGNEPDGGKDLTQRTPLVHMSRSPHLRHRHRSHTRAHSQLRRPVERTRRGCSSRRGTFHWATTPVLMARRRQNWRAREQTARRRSRPSRRGNCLSSSEDMRPWRVAS